MASTSIDLNMLLVMLHSSELYTNGHGVIFVYQTEEWNMLFKNRLHHKTNFIALSVKNNVVVLLLSVLHLSCSALLAHVIFERYLKDL